MSRNYPDLRIRVMQLLSDRVVNLPPGHHPIDVLLTAAARMVGKDPQVAEKVAQIVYQSGLSLGWPDYGMLADKVPAAAAAAPVKPAASPKYDNSFAGRICSYMEAEGYVINKNPGEINIVYVEGCNSDGTPNDDAPNQFNDRRLVIKFENGQPKIVGNWEATTEPGWFYTDNPMNAKGAARIAFGQYLNTWQVGIHGNSRPHRALIQVAPVKVHRDFNRDGYRSGDKIDIGLFGINQHGGYDYPFNNINDSSAGCQVGRTMDGQEEFMDIVESDPRYKADHGYCFHTTIIPGDELAKKP